MNELTKKYGLNIINCAAAAKQAQKEGRFVNVMRPSKWGNPFVIGRDGTRTEVLEKYRTYILGRPDLVAALPELKEKILGCCCLPMPCHVEILVELANADAATEAQPQLNQHDDELAGFKETLTFSCRCGKQAVVGETGDGEPAILHALPYCKEFEKYDLTDYLRWNRGATDN